MHPVEIKLLIVCLIGMFPLVFCCTFSLMEIHVSFYCKPGLQTECHLGSCSMLAHKIITELAYTAVVSRLVFTVTGCVPF